MATLTTSPELANAALSTGPHVPAGKERIKYGALKLGCYSATVVLPHEDHDAYAALGATLRADIRPATPAQEDTVQNIQDTHWRLTRVVAIEANLHVLGTQQHLASIDEQFGTDLTKPERYALAQAAAFQAHARAFEQLSKQEGRLNRVLVALRKEIAAIIDMRRRLAMAPPAPAAIPNGFVRAPVPQMPTFTGPMADIKKRNWLRQHGLTTK